MDFVDGIDKYCKMVEEYMNKDTIQDLREEINKMTALVNGFRKENEELKKENARLYLENEKLREENKKLYLMIEKLERENQETYDDYCEAKGENDELKEQVKCLAECCNKLNDDYCKLKEAKEVKVYKEFDVEEFFKRFGANMEISLSPYTEPSITAYATDLNGVDLLRYSAGYMGHKFDDLFAPLYKYLASTPIERVVIAKELDKIREVYNNLEAKYQSACSQISKYDEDLRDWKEQAIKNAGNLIKAKNTITTLNLKIEKLKGGFKEKDKCIERLRNELQKYEKSKPNKKYPSFYEEDYYDNWWG